MRTKLSRAFTDVTDGAFWNDKRGQIPLSYSFKKKKKQPPKSENIHHSSSGSMFCQMLDFKSKYYLNMDWVRTAGFDI